MSCLLCHVEKFDKVHDHGEGHALWRCAACGLLQTMPMPTGSELSEYYQRYDVMGEREPYYKMMWGKEAFDTPEGRDVRERYSWAKGHCGKFGKILDVGSGPGLFLRLAKEEGGEPMGAELNARAAERSAAELGIPVVSGGIERVVATDFDAVTLWDLLEHVADPAKLIAACRARLKEGGWLFIETPDEASFLDCAVRAFAKIGISGPAATFYGLHHLVLFRRETVRRMLEENGFSVTEIRGAETDPGRIFRGNGFKDKMTRLGLRALFVVAGVFNRRNKMLVAARKI
jgi:2-polyprenyl-3-methyl-5-hydroxy-6-metoxy-1,4-benzoquinol methylase